MDASIPKDEGAAAMAPRGPAKGAMHAMSGKPEPMANPDGRLGEPADRATRLVIAGGGDGWRNLATEEYLMDHTGPEDATLYFFVNDRAVIIGRSQNPWAECNLAKMRDDGVQLVRRITGGGAVYHDRGNLNFSFIMGRERYDLKKQLGLILEAVRAMGVRCEFSGRNDLLAEGRKFSGNAFCERGHARLHHGTLLVDSDLDRLQSYLNVDPRKLAAKGTKSVRARVCNLSRFVPGLDVDAVRTRLAAAFCAAYGECAPVRAEDCVAADALAPYVARHASDAWRLGETPRFDCEIDHRFAWGGMQLLLRLKGGAIEGLDVYTDANDALLAERIRRRLAGAAFGSEPIARALREEGDAQMDELADYVAGLRL